MPPGLLETALPAPQDPDARASADTLLPGHWPPATGRRHPRPLRSPPSFCAEPATPREETAPTRH